MADETPKVVQVPVKKYDVDLTLEDIMTPLAAFAQQAHVAQAAAAAPEVRQHAADLSGLAKQILEVANKLNAVAPHLLKPGPQRSQGG